MKTISSHSARAHRSDSGDTPLTSSAPLLVETREAANLLSLSVSTLEKWRFFRTPGTPPVVRIGRACRYRLTDLQEWVARLENQMDGAGEQ